MLGEGDRMSRGTESSGYTRSGKSKEGVVRDVLGQGQGLG